MSYKTAHPDRYGILKMNASENKKYSTEAESILWECLKGKALGVKFRRQHCIGDYIADFVCLSSLLVIEIDGEYHNSDEQKQEDEIRTHNLNKLGFRVIRFTNEEVINETDYVLEAIENSI